ncbi:unnamed protein product [Ostreobium quekettii]|uniref:Uncharacterized protein n=1 Tax=Ostreobium quekettii TaxID=121088 RepID=A0A8S1JHR3_9CHLO|nr:unnamed protein product [Ostreobium quekettii]
MPPDYHNEERNRFSNGRDGNCYEYRQLERQLNGNLHAEEAPRTRRISARTAPEHYQPRRHHPRFVREHERGGEAGRKHGSAGWAASRLQSTEGFKRASGGRYCDSEREPWDAEPSQARWKARQSVEVWQIRNPSMPSSVVWQRGTGKRGREPGGRPTYSQGPWDGMEATRSDHDSGDGGYTQYYPSTWNGQGSSMDRRHKATIAHMDGATSHGCTEADPRSSWKGGRRGIGHHGNIHQFGAPMGARKQDWSGNLMIDGNHLSSFIRQGAGGLQQSKDHLGACFRPEEHHSGSARQHAAGSFGPVNVSPIPEKQMPEGALLTAPDREKKRKLAEQGEFKVREGAQGAGLSGGVIADKTGLLHQGGALSVMLDGGGFGREGPVTTSVWGAGYVQHRIPGPLTGNRVESLARTVLQRADCPSSMQQAHAALPGILSVPTANAAGDAKAPDTGFSLSLHVRGFGSPQKDEVAKEVVLPESPVTPPAEASSSPEKRLPFYVEHDVPTANIPGPDASSLRLLTLKDSHLNQALVEDAVGSIVGQSDRQSSVAYTPQEPSAVSEAEGFKPLAGGNCLLADVAKERPHPEPQCKSIGVDSFQESLKSISLEDRPAGWVEDELPSSESAHAQSNCPHLPPHLMAKVSHSGGGATEPDLHSRSGSQEHCETQTHHREAQKIEAQGSRRRCRDTLEPSSTDAAHRLKNPQSSSVHIRSRSPPFCRENSPVCRHPGVHGSHDARGAEVCPGFSHAHCEVKVLPYERSHSRRGWQPQGERMRIVPKASDPAQQMQVARFSIPKQRSRPADECCHEAPADRLEVWRGDALGNQVRRKGISRSCEGREFRHLQGSRGQRLSLSPPLSTAASPACENGVPLCRQRDALTVHEHWHGQECWSGAYGPIQGCSTWQPRYTKHPWAAQVSAPRQQGRPSGGRRSGNPKFEAKFWRFVPYSSHGRHQEVSSSSSDEGYRFKNPCESGDQFQSRAHSLPQQTSPAAQNAQEGVNHSDKQGGQRKSCYQLDDQDMSGYISGKRGNLPEIFGEPECRRTRIPIHSASQVQEPGLMQSSVLHSSGRAADRGQRAAPKELLEIWKHQPQRCQSCPQDMLDSSDDDGVYRFKKPQSIRSLSRSKSPRMSPEASPACKNVEQCGSHDDGQHEQVSGHFQEAHQGAYQLASGDQDHALKQVMDPESRENRIPSRLAMAALQLQVSRPAQLAASRLSCKMADRKMHTTANCQLARWSVELDGIQDPLQDVSHSSDNDEGYRFKQLHRDACRSRSCSGSPTLRQGTSSSLRIAEQCGSHDERHSEKYADAFKADHLDACELLAGDGDLVFQQTKKQEATRNRQSSWSPGATTQLQVSSLAQCSASFLRVGHAEQRWQAPQNHQLARSTYQQHNSQGTSNLSDGDECCRFKKLQNIGSRSRSKSPPMPQEASLANSMAVNCSCEDDRQGEQRPEHPEGEQQNAHERAFGNSGDQHCSIGELKGRRSSIPKQSPAGQVQVSRPAQSSGTSSIGRPLVQERQAAPKEQLTIEKNGPQSGQDCLEAMSDSSNDAGGYSFRKPQSIGCSSRSGFPETAKDVSVADGIVRCSKDDNSERLCLSFAQQQPSAETVEGQPPSNGRRTDRWRSYFSELRAGKRVKPQMRKET